MNAKQDPTDGNKAAFRKYLEDHGVIRQLTRVLVGLYETSERPLNALDYIKRHLGAPTGKVKPLQAGTKLLAGTVGVFLNLTASFIQSFSSDVRV